MTLPARHEWTRESPVDLALVGADYPPETMRALHNLSRKPALRWAHELAWSLREIYIEQQRGLFPYPPAAVAAAILKRWEEA